MRYLNKLQTLLDPTLAYEGRSFRIKTDGKVGHNWGNMSSFDFENTEARRGAILKEMDL